MNSQAQIKIDYLPEALLVLAVLIVSQNCSNRGHSVRENNPGSQQEISAEAPANMVPVHTPDEVFWIDRYEVAAIPGPFYISSPNQDPLTRVTLNEARNICNSMGKSLCRESQWMNACLGTTRMIHGYGQTYTQGLCNVSKRISRPTGSFRECLADGQIYDMIGNVMEWVESDSSSGLAAGGSYQSGTETNCFSRHIASPDSRSPQVGFRCCKNG